MTLKNQGIGDKSPRSSLLRQELTQELQTGFRGNTPQILSFPKCKDSHFFLFLNLSKLEPARVSELANPYLLIQLLDHAGKVDKGRKKTLQAPQNLTRLTGGCSRYAEHPMTRLSRFTKPNFTVLLGRKGPGFSNHRRHNIGSFKLFGVLVLPGGFTFCWQTAYTAHYCSKSCQLYQQQLLG